MRGREAFLAEESDSRGIVALVAINFAGITHRHLPSDVVAALPQSSVERLRATKQPRRTNHAALDDGRVWAAGLGARARPARDPALVDS